MRYERVLGGSVYEVIEGVMGSGIYYWVKTEFLYCEAWDPSCNYNRQSRYGMQTLLAGTPMYLRSS